MKLLYEVLYRYFKAPWELGPRDELVALVENGRIAPCRAIDLGCGTGDNAIFLAQHGFDVTGVDFSPAAIKKARRKADAADVAVHFVVDDLTMLRHVTGTFDLLVDYGTFDDLNDHDREKYLDNVLPLTHPASRFLLWCFEWPRRWWEPFIMRLLPIGNLALEPGDAQRYFGRHFAIERVAGGENLVQAGMALSTACYIMTRQPQPAVVPLPAGRNAA